MLACLNLPVAFDGITASSSVDFTPSEWFVDGAEL